MIKILFLAAIPQDTTALQIDEEMRAIDQALRMAEYHERFDLRSHWAVRYGDLQELLLRHQPHIVHFSGHGSAASEIILEGEAGLPHPVEPEALSTLFAILKDNLRCVILNACYSEGQARAIATHIDCVIGMADSITDAASINFAAAFYQALGYGRSIQEAFALGCNAIDLAHLTEKAIPQLLTLHSDPAKAVFVVPESSGPAVVAQPERVAALPVQPLPHLSHNLPLLRDQLIGREAEVATVQQLLLRPTVGLVTLTGPGGIGKTRLALQVAANLLDHFADGVYCVSLAPVRDAALVIPEIAQTLGLREAGGRPFQESLQNYLQQRQLLLVLDNFEQVVAAAPFVADLLARCWRLKVLVTSRATLHLYGEHEFLLLPLALPDANRLTAAPTDLLASVEHCAAVELFRQRARAAKPNFVLTTSNVVPVAQICIGLDGLPLAIELAAARVKLFSPPALLTRLQQRLTLLTGGPHDLPERQRTLRGEIAWSYDLLSINEQMLFRRLAVFTGGFTLEAAQAVANVNGALGVDVLDDVASLVDQNLLKQVEQSDGEPRFDMLETIREYGLEQLAARDELTALQRRHAEYYLSLAEEGNRHRQRGEQGIWLPRMEREQSNWRTALAWSRSAGDVEQELRLAGALWYFWLYYGYLHEGRHYLDDLLVRSGGLGSQQAQANVLEGAGALAFVQGDNQTADLRLTKSLALARAMGDKRLIANVLRDLGWVALHCTGDQARAAVQFEESLTIARELSDKFSIAMGLYAWGELAEKRGEYGQACCFFEESQAIWRELGAKWDVAMALNAQGLMVRRQGDRVRARALFKASLALWQELGSSRAFSIPVCLEELARLYAIDKELVHAARLFGAAEALREIIGVPLLGNDLAVLGDDIAAMHIQMSAKAFLEAWGEGHALPPEQAIEYALALPEFPTSASLSVRREPVASVPPTYPAGLTEREVEVLRLLVEGLTYAQIADKLIISRRTVNAHITSIYGKLGVTSRALAARFAIENSLI